MVQYRYLTAWEFHHVSSGKGHFLCNSTLSASSWSTERGMLAQHSNTHSLLLAEHPHITLQAPEQHFPSALHFQQNNSKKLLPPTTSQAHLTHSPKKPYTPTASLKMADPDAMDSESTFVPFTIPERIQQLNEIDKVHPLLTPLFLTHTI